MRGPLALAAVADGVAPERAHAAIDERIESAQWAPVYPDITEGLIAAPVGAGGGRIKRGSSVG